MRGLIIGHVIWALARLLRRPGVAPIALTISAYLSVRKAFCFSSLSWKSIGHAHQRTAEAVVIGRIEIEIDVAVAVEAAVDAGAGLHRAEIVVAHRVLPARAPFWRPGRDRCGLDRPAVGLHLAHVAAADEAVRTVIEIVAVELVDAHSDRAGGDERIEVEFLVVEEPIDARHGLVGEVAADHAGIGDGIVRLSDLRMQQKLHIENRITPTGSRDRPAAPIPRRWYRRR